MHSRRDSDVRSRANRLEIVAIFRTNHRLSFRMPTANATAPLRTGNPHSRGTSLKSKIRSTIRSERFACAGRSFRRNLCTPSKKPPTASYPDLNHYRELANCTVRHNGSSGRESVGSWRANSVRSIFRICFRTIQSTLARFKTEIGAIFNQCGISPIVYNRLSLWLMS